MSIITNNRVIDVAIVSEDWVEPVTLDHAKTYMRVDYDDDDMFISNLITAARKRIERLCGISIVDKTLKVVIECVNRQELPYGPVKSVITTGLTFIGNEFKRLVGEGEFTVEYTVGYDPAPDDLLLAIKAEVLYRYENRGDVLPENSLSPEAKRLSAPFNRVLWL